MTECISRVMFLGSWKSLHPDQIGRLISYVFRKHPEAEVHATNLYLRVTVSGRDFPETLEAELSALADSPLVECPCGCKADMLLGVCYRDDEKVPNGLLTPKEKELVNVNEVIKAIKAVRERTKVGLLEAKNMVDAYRHQDRFK